MVEQQSSPSQEALEGPYKVDYIYDGDTIKLEDGTKIRFLLVDTPEVYNVDTPEPYAEEASAFTKSLLTDQEVFLEYDKERTDPYGRTLAYVYMADGKMVNELLVEEGLADVKLYEPNDKYHNKLLDVQNQAQKKKKGMWEN